MVNTDNSPPPLQTPLNFVPGAPRGDDKLSTRGTFPVFGNTLALDKDSSKEVQELTERLKTNEEYTQMFGKQVSEILQKFTSEALARAEHKDQLSKQIDTFKKEI